MVLFSFNMLCVDSVHVLYVHVHMYKHTLVTPRSSRHMMATLLESSLIQDHPSSLGLNDDRGIPSSSM